MNLFHRRFQCIASEERLRASFHFGAFTGERFRILGEDVARRQDTVAAAAPLPGFGVPDYSERTPWGVPAFFRGVAPRGDIFFPLDGALARPLGCLVGAVLAPALRRLRTLALIVGVRRFI